MIVGGAGVGREREQEQKPRLSGFLAKIRPF